MARKLVWNPTAVGAVSVLIWGSALPIVKQAEERVGLLAFTGIVYTAMFAIGAVGNALRGSKIPLGTICRNRIFYARWLFFVLHEGLLTVGVFLVQRRHMPFLILLNYLWPTAVILCSVSLASVKVTRWWALCLGSVVVICSIGVEVIGGEGIRAELFSRRQDCLAYLLVLVGAICWGMYSALSRSEGDATGGSTVLPLFQATLGLALPLSFFVHKDALNRVTPTFALLLFAYAFLLSLAYLAWDQGVRHGNLVVLSLLADLIPWLSLLSASLILGVHIGSKAAISAVVLVGGAVVTRFGTLQKGPKGVHAEPNL